MVGPCCSSIKQLAKAHPSLQYHPASWFIRVHSVVDIVLVSSGQNLSHIGVLLGFNRGETRAIPRRLPRHFEWFAISTKSHLLTPPPPPTSPHRRPLRSMADPACNAQTTSPPAYLAHDRPRHWPRRSPVPSRPPDAAATAFAKVSGNPRARAPIAPRAPPPHSTAPARFPPACSPSVINSAATPPRYTVHLCRTPPHHLAGKHVSPLPAARQSVPRRQQGPCKASARLHPHHKASAAATTRHPHRHRRRDPHGPPAPANPPFDARWPESPHHPIGWISFPARPLPDVAIPRNQQFSASVSIPSISGLPPKA